MMIKSKLLDEMKPKIEQTVKLIKNAIENKEPIIIRHDADTDGYSAAIALERAIMPLLYTRHTKERDLFYYYSRMPCKTPWYDIQDALRDVTNFMSGASRFTRKKPLIIVCDNGASAQDYIAIKLVKTYGAKVLVIDHHPNAKEIDEIVDLHLNPHHFKSTYDFCTGMLCAEIANLLTIDRKIIAKDFEVIAAVAATGDKVKSEEAQQYLKIANEKGYDSKKLRDISKCIDFAAFKLGVINDKDIVDDILGADKEKQKALLDLFTKEVNKKMHTVFESALKYTETEETDNKTIVKVPIDKLSKRNGYPARGRVTGVMQEYYKEKGKKAITLGITKTSTNFRCSNEIESFDVNEIIKKIKEKFPYANVSGGGHRVAGSISFIEASYDEVMEFILDYCKKAK
jgi:archaea-specific RecJ-like exonuclease